MTAKHLLYRPVVRSVDHMLHDTRLSQIVLARRKFVLEFVDQVAELMPFR